MDSPRIFLKPSGDKLRMVFDSESGHIPWSTYGHLSCIVGDYGGRVIKDKSAADVLVVDPNHPYTFQQFLDTQPAERRPPVVLTHWIPVCISSRQLIWLDHISWDLASIPNKQPSGIPLSLALFRIFMAGKVIDPDDIPQLVADALIENGLDSTHVLGTRTVTPRTVQLPTPVSTSPVQIRDNRVVGSSSKAKEKILHSTPLSRSRSLIRPSGLVIHTLGRKEIAKPHLVPSVRTEQTQPHQSLADSRAITNPPCPQPCAAIPQKPEANKAAHSSNSTPANRSETHELAPLASASNQAMTKGHSDQQFPLRAIKLVIKPTQASQDCSTQEPTHPNGSIEKSTEPTEQRNSPITAEDSDGDSSLTSIPSYSPSTPTFTSVHVARASTHLTTVQNVHGQVPNQLPTSTNTPENSVSNSMTRKPTVYTSRAKNMSRLLPPELAHPKIIANDKSGRLQWDEDDKYVIACLNWRFKRDPNELPSNIMNDIARELTYRTDRNAALWNEHYRKNEEVYATKVQLLHYKYHNRQSTTALEMRSLMQEPIKSPAKRPRPSTGALQVSGAGGDSPHGSSSFDPHIFDTDDSEGDRMRLTSRTKRRRWTRNELIDTPP